MGVVINKVKRARTHWEKHENEEEEPLSEEEDEEIDLEDTNENEDDDKSEETREDNVVMLTAIPNFPPATLLPCASSLGNFFIRSGQFGGVPIVP